MHRALLSGGAVKVAPLIYSLFWALEYAQEKREDRCNGKVIVSGRGGCVPISSMDSCCLFYGNTLAQGPLKLMRVPLTLETRMTKFLVFGLYLKWLQSDGKRIL